MTEAAAPAGAGGEIRLWVDPADPCLPGHFPGRPILPGVVLLDALVAALRGPLSHPAPHGAAIGQAPATGQASGAGRALVLEAVKLTAPVLPGQWVTLRWAQTAPGRAAFQAEAAGVRVLSGRAVWTAGPPS
ncbi:MAG: hypothetical protein KGL52_12860 [Rhodospirillales bacterium]|nr:hypothetical protein [Rhodospirillales bacterium]